MIYKKWLTIFNSKIDIIQFSITSGLWRIREHHMYLTDPYSIGSQPIFGFLPLPQWAFCWWRCLKSKVVSAFAKLEVKLRKRCYGKEVSLLHHFVPHCPAPFIACLASWFIFHPKFFLIYDSWPVLCLWACFRSSLYSQNWPALHRWLRTKLFKKTLTGRTWWAGDTSMHFWQHP